MKNFSSFDEVTGRFHSFHVVPDAFHAPDDWSAVEGVFDDQTAYVDVNEVPPVQRWKSPHTYAVTKTTIFANASDTARIVGVPAHARVIWPDGSQEEVHDGFIDFATDLPGVHRITIDAVQYLPAVIEITAQ